MIDLAPIFKSYEILRAEADAVFARIEEKYPQCVKCKPGCSDCCHALFDLSLVEAMYINQAFKAAFDYGRERSDILEKASEIDRNLARLKKDMFRAEKNGENPEKIIAISSSRRIPCPLLSDSRHCLLYESRPITCRLYGVPQAIGNESHVCGFSAFEKGVSYPTVQIAKFQARLEDLSSQIAKAAGSRFNLTDVYVPLSMALLTNYDDAWLGIGDARVEE